MKRSAPLSLSIVILLSAAVLACGVPVKSVVSNDLVQREQAIVEFRDLGPQGLSTLLKYREQLLRDGKEPDSAVMIRLNDAIDSVGGAKYSATSRLYWFTDLELAKAEATETGKPILSLRMLGKLTDDLSCANSRFFRTTLYANEEISKLLREKFILHWQSVRPVPKITIDFGDGRKLERTITGNSAHYVLLADGTVIDCLPGLYGPQAFRSKLEDLLKVTEALPKDAEMRRSYLVAFHRSEETKINQAWQTDLTKLGVGMNAAGHSAQVRLPAAAAPPAEAAAEVARPKAMLEMPAIRAIANRRLTPEQATTDEVWEKIAALHADDSRLDPASRKLIAAQNPTAAVAGKLAETKRRVEDPLVKMFRNLEQAVAVDSVRNEYELHRQLHRWFIDGTAAANVDELNERVYAELFLTPKSDPWLGLLPADAYSALPNNGVVQAK